MLNKINKMIDTLKNKEKKFDKELEELNEQRQALEKDKIVNNVRLSLLRLASLPSDDIDDLLVETVNSLTNKYFLKRKKKTTPVSDENPDADGYDYYYDFPDEDESSYDSDDSDSDDIDEYPLEDEGEDDSDVDNDDVYDADDEDECLLEEDESIDDKDNNDVNDICDNDNDPNDNNNTANLDTPMSSWTSKTDSKNDFYDEMISSVDELEDYGKKLKKTKTSSVVVFDE